MPQAFSEQNDQLRIRSYFTSFEIYHKHQPQFKFADIGSSKLIDKI